MEAGAAHRAGAVKSFDIPAGEGDAVAPPPQLKWLKALSNYLGLGV
jgi:hypothetical protein